MAQAAYEDAVAKMSNDAYGDNEGGGGGGHGRGGGNVVNVEKSNRNRGESAESVNNGREESFFLNTNLTHNNTVNGQHDEKAMSRQGCHRRPCRGGLSSTCWT